MTREPTVVSISRSHRKVIVEHKEKTKKPGKAGGVHIRMAIADRYRHVSMTESEARHLARVLTKYADTMP